MSYIHQDILRRKKKCMFGKDEEPAKEPYSFDGWITMSGDAGTTADYEFRLQDCTWVNDGTWVGDD